jgi:uracil-DNA glycosylase
MADIIWVGLSAKLSRSGRMLSPLDETTPSGKLLSEVESFFPNLTFLRANLVDFPPTDQEGKLRYPTLQECNESLPNLLDKLESIQPKIVFLLGKIVTECFLKSKLLNTQKNDCDVCINKPIKYIGLQHPSYIQIYKRKEKVEYIEKIMSAINGELQVSKLEALAFSRSYSIKQRSYTEILI